MKKTTLSILAVAAVLAADPLAAQSASPDAAAYFAFLSAADRQTLLSKGELTATGVSSAVLSYGAKSPFASEIDRAITIKGSVALEGFFLFPRPAGNVDLGLYNAVNALATMEGLEYFSVSRQQMETLILASWRVNSKENSQKIADPSFTVIPPFQRAVVYQKDNKLGDGHSEVTWRALAGGMIAMTLKNLDTLNYGFIPLVDPGNLQMLFVVVPLADKIAVYGLMEGKTAQLFGLERSKDESFRNRMRALASWLGQRIATLK